MDTRAKGKARGYDYSSTPKKRSHQSAPFDRRHS
ncbi:hypothetical protein DESC_720199 [Desulfosarcina cetonica]|nr:hypothetical protein DESC_720199 [Desulfosarcina cetonica]